MSKSFVGVFLILISSFLIAPGSPLTVTEPSSGTIWHLHSRNVVKWQSVSTDPESVEVRIVNNNPAAFPTGFTRTVKDGINTADNQFTIESLPGLKPGHGYQVNIMSTAGTILAQSAQFSINGTMESNTTSSTTHPPQSIAQPTLAAPSPSTSSSASSDASTLRTSSMGHQLTAVTLMTFGLLAMKKFGSL